MLDTNNTNAFVNVTKNAGRLYLAMAINWNQGSGNQSVIRWMQVNALIGSVSVTQYGTIGASDGTLSYYYPSSAGGPSTNPYQVIKYAQSGSNTYPSTAILAIDSTGAITSNYWNYQGTVAYTDQYSQTTIGCTTYPCYRWGDYSSMYNDPSNVNLFWDVAQTASTATVWGTQIAGHTFPKELKP